MNLIDATNIDALTCTIINIPEYHKSDVIKGFEQILATQAIMHDRNTGEIEFASGGYRRTVKIPIIDKEFTKVDEPKYIRIYIEPNNPKKAFVKFSLYKHPYQKEHYAIANKILSQLFIYCDYNYLIASHVCVKAIDIAIDKNVSITNLWYDKSRSQVTMTVHNRRGKLETVYLGRNRSKKRVRIYDKAAQKKSRSHKHLSGYKLLRVEFCFKLDCSIAEVFKEIDMASELKSFSMYKGKAIRSAQIFSDEVWSIIQYVGIKSILQSMAQSDRRRTRKELSPFKTKLISAKELKESMRSLSMDLIILMDGETHI